MTQIPLVSFFFICMLLSTAFAVDEIGEFGSCLIIEFGNSPGINQNDPGKSLVNDHLHYTSYSASL